MSERYEIQDIIGKGGLGIVYRARDTALGRDVAIKRVQFESGEPADELTDALVDEARTLSMLNHPHIVTIHDVGQDAEGPYVVMELLEGEPLNEIIKRATLTINDFKDVAMQTLEALVAAQSVGIIHRDLKPENIMVVWLPSGKFQIKVLDFGLARFAHKPTAQTMNQRGSILGSIYFMAPEQFQRQPLDARSDLYSLGAILYYTLTAEHPFQGDSPVGVMTAHLQHIVTPLRQLRPDTPDAICAWVERLMARNMDDRPASAQAAMDAWCPDPVLDEGQVREVASGDSAIAAELLADFLEECRLLVTQLQQELENGQAAEAQETARTIRGTASTLGYAEIICIARGIEQDVLTAPGECDVGSFAAAFERLREAVDRIEWND